MPDVNRYIADIDNLPADVDRATREATAARLAERHYSPLLSVDAPNFLQYTKTTLKQRCLQIIDNDSNPSTTTDHNAKIKHIKLLLHQYKLLQRLRQDDPEAWSLVEELFGED